MRSTEISSLQQSIKHRSELHSLPDSLPENRRPLTSDQKKLANEMRIKLHRQLVKAIQQNIELKQKQYLAKRELEKELLKKAKESNRRKVIEFFIHLFPVLLIGTVATKTMPVIEKAQLNGMPVMAIMLFLALCIPWMTQMASMPLYSRIGHETYRFKNIKVEKIILRYTPSILILASLFEALFVAIVSRFAHFDTEITLIIFGSCFLHSLFALLMTYGTATKNWGPWLTSWMIYGLFFYIFPVKLLYPPLASSMFMLSFLILKNGTIPTPTIEKDFASYMILGAVVGTIIWIDKILAFNFTYVIPGVVKPFVDFNHWMIFVPLLPSIIGLNCYYVFLAPQLEKKLNDLIYSMDKENLQKFISKKRALYKKIQEIWAKVFLVTISLSLLFSYFYAKLNSIAVVKVLGIFLLPATLTNITIILNSLMILKYRKTIYKTAIIITLINIILLIAALSGNMEVLKTYNGHSITLTCLMLAVLVVLTSEALKKWHGPHIAVLRGDS